MTTQIDLFTPASSEEPVDDCPTHDDQPVDKNQGQPIAVPCGFLDRANKPCQRLGYWPVMMDGKQMVCRGRPMVHCDPACFSSAQTPSTSYPDEDDILWEDRDQSYGEAA